MLYLPSQSSLSMHFSVKITTSHQNSKILDPPQTPRPCGANLWSCTVTQPAVMSSAWLLGFVAYSWLGVHLWCVMQASLTQPELKISGRWVGEWEGRYSMFINSYIRANLFSLLHECYTYLLTHHYLCLSMTKQVVWVIVVGYGKHNVHLRLY